MFDRRNSSSTSRHHRRMKRMMEALRDELTIQGIIGQGTTTDLRVHLINLAEIALMACDFDTVND